jgi:alanyl-tRNA synthetase
MTTRLYYTEQDRRTFEAVVQSCRRVDDRLCVQLDATAFYPSSGGQPFDTGRLGQAAVLDVFENDEGTIEHVVDVPLDAGARVSGVIDWTRRFDHMQQHTGQHILSAAFDRTAGVRTQSFHLGSTTSTIDLAREVTTAECDRAERETNQIMWEDRPVTVRFATPEEALRLPLRKESSRSGLLRLVEVESFDLSACGGTHVARAGMIGSLVIVQAERFKGGSRVTFVCGGRALASHRQLRSVVSGVTRALSVSSEHAVAAVERVIADARETARHGRKAQELLAHYKGDEMRREAETIGPCRVVLRAEPGYDAAALKGLASAVVSAPGTIALLCGAGQPAAVVLACGAGVTVNAGALLKDMLAAIGGRGGGTAAMAQGATDADPTTMFLALRSRLRAAIAPTGASEPIE